MMLYEALNAPLLKFLPDQLQHVLDIGCGTGQLGRYIKQNSSCQVVGMTYSEVEAAEASTYLDKVIICDLNNPSFVSLEKFDCVICSHILEHLYQPQNLLNRLHEILLPGGKLIIALPNVMHWKQRLEFLKGNFKYTEGGLMDKTHFRFFDWETAFELIESSGFQVLKRYADGYLPLPGIRKLVPSIVPPLDQFASTKMPGLCGLQFIFVAQSSKDV